MLVADQFVYRLHSQIVKSHLRRKREAKCTSKNRNFLFICFIHGVFNLRNCCEQKRQVGYRDQRDRWQQSGRKMRTEVDCW